MSPFFPIASAGILLAMMVPAMAATPTPPPGPYRATCSSPTVYTPANSTVPLLAASCRFGTSGNTRGNALDWKSCGSKPIINVDGHLECPVAATMGQCVQTIEPLANADGSAPHPVDAEHYLKVPSVITACGSLSKAVAQLEKANLGVCDGLLEKDVQQSNTPKFTTDGALLKNCGEPAYARKRYAVLEKKACQTEAGDIMNCQSNWGNH